MEHKTIKPDVKPPNPKEMFVIDPVTGKPRFTFTLSEFAELHGNERDWAYKRFKQGKLKGITNLGQVYVPASEFYRLEQEASFTAGKYKEESEFRYRKNEY